jgi:hypothetical protein
MKFLQFFKHIMGNEQGIFGLFSKPTQINFNPAAIFAPAEKKIGGLQSFAESAIEGPSQAGRLIQEDIDRQQRGVFDRQNVLQQRDLQNQMSNIALYGGRGGGAGERAARQSMIRGEETRQGLFDEFAGIRTGALASDLSNEQSRRDQARRDALNAEMNLVGTRSSSELARAGIQASRDAQRSAMLGQKLGAIGGLFGGKRGAAIGSAFGGILS